MTLFSTDTRVSTTSVSTDTQVSTTSIRPTQVSTTSVATATQVSIIRFDRQRVSPISVSTDTRVSATFDLAAPSGAARLDVSPEIVLHNLATHRRKRSAMREPACIQWRENGQNLGGGSRVYALSSLVTAMADYKGGVPCRPWPSPTLSRLPGARAGSWVIWSSCKISAPSV
jgi:hypothetical protein